MKKAVSKGSRRVESSKVDKSIEYREGYEVADLIKQYKGRKW